MSPAEVVGGLCIFGFGGHARSVADVALSAGFDRLLFIDANARPGERFGGFDALPELPERIGPDWQAFPALGDNQGRRALWDDISLPMARLVAGTASLGVEASIEAGVLVGHHAHVGPAARIGRGTIINTGAVVDHETVVGEFAHVSVNATVAGRCRIGANVLVGAGAVVVDRISICDDAIIGAGATVVADITAPGTYVGTPARLLVRR